MGNGNNPDPQTIAAQINLPTPHGERELPPWELTDDFQPLMGNGNADSVPAGDTAAGTSNPSWGTGTLNCWVLNSLLIVFQPLMGNGNT